MSGRRLPTLERSGRAEFVPLEDATQRALTNLDARSIPYVASTPASWVSPAPVTAQQAFDRISAWAAAGATPGPIP